MKNQLLILTILVALSCGEKPTSESQPTTSQADSKPSSTSTSKIDAPLIHIVLLDLKPGIDPDLVIRDIREIEGLPEIAEFRTGKYIDLDDSRSLENFEVAIYTTFENVEAYEAYQKNEVHLALRDKLYDVLLRYPVTYDFMAE